MKNKVDLIKELWKEDPSLSDEELDKRFDIGFDMMEEITQSKDVNLLPDLLELFTDENEDYGGVCERLQNNIEDNYSVYQIIDAVLRKIDYLVENDLDRLVNMSQIFFNKKNAKIFSTFRNKFNTIKPNRAKEFLDKLAKSYSQGYIEYANILREDMKKW